MEFRESYSASGGKEESCLVPNLDPHHNDYLRNRPNPEMDLERCELAGNGEALPKS